MKRRNRYAKTCAAGVVAALVGTGAAVAQTSDDLPYKDITLPFAERVADLVSRMTLAEKADQVQMATPPNFRLGLPGCNWWSESLHGVGRANSATIYPQAIGLAATWNPALIQNVADAISDEARMMYDPAGTRYRGLMLWCPTVNMARDPRWGRVEETYGEDPYLTSRIGVAFVKGLQGNDPKYLKAVATPKHFAAHSQEVGRMSRSVTVSEEMLRDYYLPAFEACFVEGGALSVMAAHNSLNSIPCTANRMLLTDVLRNDWKFEGSVVTDWSGVTQMVSGHRFMPNDVASVAAAIHAGVDVVCDPRPYAGAVIQAVESGQLPDAVLNRAVTRNLTLRFRLGMFDPPEKLPFGRTPATKIGSREHIALALQSAREATVLIKNDPAPRGYGFERILPLDLRRIDSIAVIGPYADLLQFGAYSAPSPAGPSLTILDALKAAVGDRVQINTADWPDIDGSARAAAKSTVAVVVMGLNVTIEKEGIDRSTLELPPDQRMLIERVVAANPLTIVVLEGGSPIGLEWMKANVPAVINIWYPGEQGGNATADVLLGKYNPAGRLPLTYHRSVADLPSMNDYAMVNGRTYMYLKTPVTYSFGHGLSYTTFDYKALRAPAHAEVNGTIEVAVDVANSGDRDGDEVAQLYVRKKESARVRPQMQLKGFERVNIARGATRTVKLRLPIASLGLWNVQQHKYVVEPGAYELMVGPSSGDLRVRATIDIK